MNRKARRMASAIKRGKAAPMGYPKGMEPGGAFARYNISNTGRKFLENTSAVMTHKESR